MEVSLQSCGIELISDTAVEVVKSCMVYVQHKKVGIVNFYELKHLMQNR